MADLLPRVRGMIERHGMVSPGETVVAAVSGGPDSVALAHLLWRLAAGGSFRLQLAHLNHRFRPGEAEAEAAFVAGLAERWALPCTVETVDVPAVWREEGGSPEEVARRVRYAFLDRVAQATGAGRIALGHQADDQAETVVMSLLRGAGAHGLAGIRPVREGRYIRPLLEVRRAEILAYLDEQGLAYRLDSSNASPVYWRNRVRLELMPLLERFSPNLTDVLGRTAAVLRAEDEYLEATAAAWVEAQAREQKAAGAGANAGLAVPSEGLAALPEALSRRVVRQVWRRLTGGPPTAELGFERVEAVLGLAREGRTGARIQLPGGVEVRRGYGVLVWQEGEAKVPAARGAAAELGVPGETFFPPAGLRLRAQLEPAGAPPDLAGLAEEGRRVGAMAATLDAGRVEAPLTVRFRRPGDRFWPLGAPGETKLKDFLIAAKVPAGQRERLPLVADRGGERIVWVVGQRPAQPVAVTAATRLLLRLTADWP
ncbi:MAG: tRNA lysidine(34) synthetase TilS [Chitinophagales bacterium]